MNKKDKNKMQEEISQYEKDKITYAMQSKMKEMLMRLPIEYRSDFFIKDEFGCTKDFGDGRCELSDEGYTRLMTMVLFSNETINIKEIPQDVLDRVNGERKVA